MLRLSSSAQEDPPEACAHQLDGEPHGVSGGIRPVEWELNTAIVLIRLGRDDSNPF